MAYSTTITSFFSEDGLPKTGLTPLIKIRDLSDDSIVINNAAMDEVADGFYKYVFTYQAYKQYTVVVDGGNTLIDAERYVFTSLPGDIDNIPGRIV